MPAPTDALVEDWAELRPIAATFAGVRGHDHRWDDLSPEGNAETERRLRAWVVRLEAEAPGLGRDVSLDWLRDEVEGLAAGEPEVDLNSLASPLQGIAMVFGSMEEGEAMAARLEGLPAALDGYRRTLDAGRGRRDGVAARQVRAGIAEARRHASADSRFAGLAGRFPAAEGARAAYGALADWLEQVLLPGAREDDAVGRERYLRAARRFLGATISPEETYAWGWGELRRIEEEMLACARSLGHDGIPEAMALAARAAVAPSAEAFLEAMRERQTMALETVRPLFDIHEALHRLDVRRAPNTGHLGAYYVQPSEDLSRPGAIWYLLADDGPQPLWREVSTAYHEGFPGHHLQVGTQVALSDLSRFQRVVAGWSGFAEGWALYAETLMDELGGYERPELRLGMLTNQLIRACRVVLDIGAHLEFPIPADAPFEPGERWTFERGVALLATRAGLTDAHARSEMTRYLGFPGQAISYKVGQRAMLSLRDDWLADGGTLRALHGRILRGGPVGLARLRAHVGRPD